MPWPIFKNGKILFRNGKLAFSLDCCCEATGSSATCCDDELGEWPDNYPADVFVTISGSCCADMNKTWQLKNMGGATPVYDTIAYTMIRIEGCGGVDDGVNPDGYGVRMILRCESGVWSLSILLATKPANPTISCPPGGGIVGVSISLVSCDPLHLTGSGETVEGDDCPARGILGFSCASSFDIDITE